MPKPASMAMPTVKPIKCPAPIKASDRANPMPVVDGPMRPYSSISPVKSWLATTAANPNEARLPVTNARNPPLDASGDRSAPTLRTSAAATPSGYGRSVCTTSARRNGTLYITPRIPPAAQTPNVSQNGKPLHQPIMTKPGRTKITADSVPAADATVCTILFSTIVAFLTARSTAIEMTAAGIVNANVRPTFNPRYTFAAVNTNVIAAPNRSPRRVSSVRRSLAGPSPAPACFIAK